jgi:hypothetical protein
MKEVLFITNLNENIIHGDKSKISTMDLNRDRYHQRTGGCHGTRYRHVFFSHTP